MSMTIRTLQVPLLDKTITVEHDQMRFIRIFDEPIGLPYEHEGKRGVQNESHMLQHIPMMDFQAKITSLLRAVLKDAKIPYPLKGQFRVEIDVTTSRSISEMPLLLLMKSVVDGINKEIVTDDHCIFSCSIKYNWRARNRRSAVTKSPDVLSVRLFDYNSSSSSPVVEFKQVHVHVVPKADPLILDYLRDVRWPLGNYDYQDDVAAALRNDGMQIAVGGPYRLHLLFLGNILSKDVDNMARMYYPILQQLGLRNEDVREIVLTKQQATPADRSCVQIVLAQI